MKEKAKYEIPEELKDIPMEQWTEEEFRRYVKNFSMYEECQRLKEMKRRGEF